ncbi:hypothetical protein ACFY1P_33850 [Streptomyces sp. NPDC001407]|uniref:hypothetical protein n=1 Tax=Streptomyces sp. NPDC001407 TaxID=3364573 RepID=UPI0036A144C2
MTFSTQATTTATTFKVDDYVLYRDPAKFWRGEPGHTIVCRIDGTINYTSGVRYDLVPVTGGWIRGAQGDYMRLLPPVDAMRDIDTAPLKTDGDVGGMTAAAVAWLTQHTATTTRRPELP